jgi:Zn-dependent oligopeptidase
MLSTSPVMRFPSTPDLISIGTSSILTKYNNWYETLSHKPFETKTDFFQFFEQTEPWDLQLESYDFMQYVHPNKEIRDSAVESSKQVADFMNKWSMNVDIYKSVQHAFDKFQSELEGEELLYFDRMLKSYKHRGIHLEQEKRDELEALNKELTEMSIKYSTNLNEVDDYIYFTKEQLKGVDEDFIESLDQEDGKYKVTTKYDHINKIMPYCEVEETRKELSTLFGHRGKEPFKNHELLQKSLSLRRKKAQLLGYNCYSDYVLGYNRMARSSDEVNEFLQTLTEKMIPISQKDVSKLKEYSKKDVLESWNLGYYSNLYKKEMLQYDQKKVQEYFPLEKLLPNLLGTFEEIFHLHIEEVELEAEKTWHESVKCYGVYDNQNNEKGHLIGHFYIDLYPRDGKYGHAAAFTLKQAYIPYSEDMCNERSTPISAMVCNFTRPTKDKPSLLTFGEVETFFHELGHIFHQLLSKNKFAMFSGTAVERDFVECPSQALENWCYEKDFLKRISSHYITNESIPDEIIEKIKENKYLFNGLHYIRQLTLAQYDMKLHSNDENVDVEEDYKKLQDKLSPLVHNPACLAANFGHLMGGYESGYYGYLWSEVYAAEVFQLFKQSGNIFNREVGLHYRQSILEKGGTRTGFEMMETLLRRSPSNDAFLEQFS